jgi:hypothetical protein
MKNSLKNLHVSKWRHNFAKNLNSHIYGKKQKSDRTTPD